jgi:hypothetical protein
MNTRPSFLLASLATACLTIAPAQAVIFLLDPSNAAGSNGAYTSGPTQPYPVSNTDRWNIGSDANFGTGVYSDNTPATGVTVATDMIGLVSGSTDTYEYNFLTAADVSTAAQASMGGVFNTNPTNTSIFGNTIAALGYGGVATRITGLPSGTYDLYIVAAYTGSTPSTRPGGTSAAGQNVWAFSRPGGADSLAASGYGTGDVLENSTNASWVQGNNYAKITVTIDSNNPDLYIVSEGITGSTETRGWLSSIQIIPEPSSFLLAAAGMIGLVARRRRSA